MWHTIFSQLSRPKSQKWWFWNCLGYGSRGFFGVGFPRLHTSGGLIFGSILARGCVSRIRWLRFVLLGHLLLVFLPRNNRNGCTVVVSGSGVNKSTRVVPCKYTYSAKDSTKRQ